METANIQYDISCVRDVSCYFTNFESNPNPSQVAKEGGEIFVYDVLPSLTFKVAEI